MRRDFYFPNMLNKIRLFVSACASCQQSATVSSQSRPKKPRIPIDYRPMSRLSCDIKYMPPGIDGYRFILVVTCEVTNFVVAVPLKCRTAEAIANALYYRVFLVYDPPTMLIIDEDTALTGHVLEALLSIMGVTAKTISPCNHGSSKTEERIKQLSALMLKDMEGKGDQWPLFCLPAAWSLNTSPSPALSGLTPWELVKGRKPVNLLNYQCHPIPPEHVTHHEYYQALQERMRFSQQLLMKIREYDSLHRYQADTLFDTPPQYEPDTLVSLFSPSSSSLQTNTRKFRKDFIGPLVMVRRYPDDTYLLKDPSTNQLLPSKYPIVRLRLWREMTTQGPITTHTALREAAQSLSAS